MIRLTLAATLLVLTPFAAAQQEGPASTQTLVAIESKTPAHPTAADLTLKVENRPTPLTGLTRVVPAGAQVALLIDDGLRESVGRQLPDLRNFVQHLPQGTEIFIGYMQNGRIVPVQDFTTEYESAAKAIRVPFGGFDQSASPYFCLSEFVKHWPAGQPSLQRTPKARFVMMITNGVDPYNGSTRMSNQDSPYVDTAVKDAQRAGVAVYSIYYADAGMRGGSASFSGQSYLGQVADATGGRSYTQGTGNPVSMTPFLNQFQGAIAETYIATFNAPPARDLVRIKLSTKLPGTKVRAAEEILPGTQHSLQE